MTSWINFNIILRADFAIFSLLASSSSSVASSVATACCISIILLLKICSSKMNLTAKGRGDARDLNDSTSMHFASFAIIFSDQSDS